MSAAVALPSDAIPLTTAIGVPARWCYELFCEASRIPEWLPAVHSARVMKRNDRGRPTDVTFLANLERATVGYRLHYSYRERDLGVSWATDRNSGIVVAGWAQFTPLSDQAALVTYDLMLDLGGTLARWEDPYLNGHPASAIMSDFRDFATRASQ